MSLISLGLTLLTSAIKYAIYQARFSKLKAHGALRATYIALAIAYLFVDIVVAEDPEAAWERIRPHYAHQLRTYVQAHDPAAQVPPAALEGRLGAARPPVSVRLSVLSPDEAVELILKRIAGLPARQVYTWASIAAMPDDLVEEHLRLFLTDVAPRVRARLAEVAA